jgi:putative acetyltransferase
MRGRTGFLHPVDATDDERLRKPARDIMLKFGKIPEGFQNPQELYGFNCRAWAWTNSLRGRARSRFACRSVNPAVPRMRRATAADSAAVQALVAGILKEFGLVGDPDGTDADLKDFDRNFHSRGGDFVVMEDEEGRVVGTCGLYPLTRDEVELRKMYLASPLRGRGAGRMLLDWGIRRARELGFRRVRLETAAVLEDAIALYERNGFVRDNGPVHASRCDCTYVRELR